MIQQLHPRYLPKEYKNTNSKGYMHPDVYSSIIYNSQIMETAQVSINRWMERDAWAAESVKHLPSASSGHDPRVLRSSPELGSLLSGESAAPSPSATPPACALLLSLSVK